MASLPAALRSVFPVWRSIKYGVSGRLLASLAAMAEVAEVDASTSADDPGGHAS